MPWLNDGYVEQLQLSVSSIKTITFLSWSFTVDVLSWVWIHLYGSKMAMIQNPGSTLIKFVDSDQQLSLRDSVSLSEILAVSLGSINKSAKTHRWDCEGFLSSPCPLSLWVARWFCWSCVVSVSVCDLVQDLTGDIGTPSMQPLNLQGAYDRAATGALVSEKPHFVLEQAPFCHSPLDKVNFTSNLYSNSFTVDCRSGQEGLQRPTDQDRRGTGCGMNGARVCSECAMISAHNRGVASGGF